MSWRPAAFQLALAAFKPLAVRERAVLEEVINVLLAHDAARSHEQSQRVIFDTKTCLARSEAAALAACLRCFLGSLSALRLRGFLSLAPAVLAMTGADSCTKSRSNGREKAVKEEPKASRGCRESHQKPHQKLHQHRPKTSEVGQGFVLIVNVYVL